MSETESSGTDRPDWLPDEYDPDAPLRERLPLIADIEGGIELHVADSRGVVEIVGEPKDFDENGQGCQKLKAGNHPDEFVWGWEIVVPKPESGESFLRDVDPMQNYEDYIRTRRTVMEDIDVRIYGVDAHRFVNGEDESAATESTKIEQEGDDA